MGHTVRGAVSAWLALIVLQTLVTRGNGRVAGALSGLSQLASRALDPNVPAIPDRRAGAAPAADAGGFFHMTPAQLDAAVRGAGTASAIQKAGPNSMFSRAANLPTVDQGTGQVDWSAVARSLPHYG